LLLKLNALLTIRDHCDRLGSLLTFEYSQQPEEADMRKVNEVVENLKKVYCRLGVSAIHGVGVFAVRKIPKGINPFADAADTKWKKVPLEDIRDIHPGIMKMIDDFGVKEGNYIWIPEAGFNNLGPSYYLNHSKSPNMAAMGGGDWFITLREIEEGEELTVDYGTYDEEGHALKF
jgi:hypothetical protein